VVMMRSQVALETVCGGGKGQEGRVIGVDMLPIDPVCCVVLCCVCMTGS